MKALSSQTGSLSTGNDANGADVLNALLEEQDRLLSSHVLATLQRYRYHERWGCSDGWLDLTWRLKQSVRTSFCCKLVLSPFSLH